MNFRKGEAILRAFFAVPLWSTVDIDVLRERFPYSPLRWVRPDQVHLTLNFLGELALDDIPLASICLRQAAQHWAPFQLRWGLTGFFQQKVGRQVFWWGVEEQSAQILGELAHSLGNTAFHPHVTLARSRSRLGEEFLQAWQEFRPPECNITVSNICLVKSKLTPQGPVYEEILKVGLKGVRRNE